MQDFWSDAVEVAKARLAAGRIDRRTLLAGLAALPAAGLSGQARAQAARPREIVLANWGGDAVRAMNDAFARPFTADHGVKVVVDSGGPSLAKIRAMVEARNVVWDVCDSGAGTSFTLGRGGFAEEMDYSIIDIGKVLPEGFRLPYCTGIAGYSSIIAWDRKKLGEGPQNWADFWDTRRFPGRRTMRKSMNAVLEAALMADGVAPDKLYPLDVDRALEKVKQIRRDVIWWDSAAQSQDLLRSGEVTAGSIWSTRARLVQEDTKGQIDYRWNQGIVHAAVWVVPKNPPAGREWAMRLVDSTILPARQVALLKSLGTGPANPAAAALVPPELKPHNPMDPDNLKLQVVADELWYADNYLAVLNRFNDVITG
jgi:putative spermidine/putrescine transport system substrate-binding protein